MTETKSKFESKKYTAMVAGLVLTVFIFSSSAIIMLILPEVASFLVNLASIALGSVATIISLYAVGQSAVDWKINSTSSVSKEERSYEEFKKHEMKYD